MLSLDVCYLSSRLALLVPSVCVCVCVCVHVRACVLAHARVCGACVYCLTTSCSTAASVVHMANVWAPLGKL